MATTLFLASPAFLGHLTGSHPECPERMVSIRDGLRAAGLLERLETVEPIPAEDSWLEAVHHPAYLERFRRACQEGRTVFDSLDNPISARSEEVARLAAGGAVRLMDLLARGKAPFAFAALRPPGHHAGPDAARGFCFYNNVAIAVRRAQTEHGVDRVLVVDFDVHHGNGTQEIFWEDGSVLYTSLHQWPLYPGTGSADETGAGEGDGRTLNLPLPPGAGDHAYREALREIAETAREFQPALVVVSAGFDAHALDPLAGMQVTEEGFAGITRDILEIATTRGIPVLSLLEGGYHLEALAGSVTAHLSAMLEA